MKTKTLLACCLAVQVMMASAQTGKPASKPIISQFSGHPIPARDYPLSPAEAAQSFTVPNDLEIEQVLAEPIVRQPVFLNFDERGRMWVVQYIQYPAPAGLNVVSRDNFWRAVYDKIPQPPPHGVKGLDKITIHEDTDGDGTFDKHKTFVDGLNIATACVKGRGGLWVLNPPYLLFYPDKDDDDVPDGDPVVHLEGFGLEDTHSVVNSLRWGPDGWLYAAQGSTVTANVRVHTAGVPPEAETRTSKPETRNGPSLTTAATTVYSQGQNIWRYHPETRRYEIFAEGGGNAFGVEIDDKGRIFSGHNGGDTRGFHYMQGAYLRKGFEKHGELSNPFAYGYFPQMNGTKGERFTHNFILNHGGALPPRYAGKLFGIEPLQGRVVLSEITPDGSTFATRDLERVVTSSDSWFRPVDIKVGPDGAIYIADWYDRQVTHTRNQEGNIDVSNGRIYRLKARGASPIRRFDLRTFSNPQLIDLLSHTNQWFRQSALRLLTERHEVALGPRLEQIVLANTGPPALEALWAWHASVKPTTAEAARFLGHPDPQIRLWTVRLIGEPYLAPSTARGLATLAAREPNVEVLAQLACSARRLTIGDALPILRPLLSRDDDANDPRLPLLLWWAIEDKCDSDGDALLKFFEDSPLWTRRIVEDQILSRLMRRFAASGKRGDLLSCARLLDLSPSPGHSAKLMAGFEEAFKGRSLAGLPDELIAAMARHNVGSAAFAVRRGNPEALDEAIRVIEDTKAKRESRLQFIEVLGEVRPRAAIDPLLRVADNDREPMLRKAALTALLGYDDSRVPAMVIKDYNDYGPEVRAAALTLLASRGAWSLALVRAVELGTIKPAAVPLETVRIMKRHKGEELAERISKLWPQTGSPTTAEMKKRIEGFAGVLRSGSGDPYRGQKLFNTACASCHTLFARGGQVGPDLTSYQRSDLETMLLHVVNPSAEIREGYESFLVETKDERALSGFLVERDDKIVVLRGADGQKITLPQNEIAEMRGSGMSLMPEGLLDPLTGQELRDLFAYLRSTQPLAN